MDNIYYTQYKSPVGKLTLAKKDNCLIGLWIENQKYFPKDINKSLIKIEDSETFKKTRYWLDQYFSGEKPDTGSLDLKLRGSDFQIIIWKLLLEIPYGKTVTYGYLAGRCAEILNKKNMSPQAVGGAVGHNPIAVIVPCHRVLGADGSLTGYAGGIEIKRKLLELEGIL